MYVFLCACVHKDVRNGRNHPKASEATTVHLIIKTGFSVQCHTEKEDNAFDASKGMNETVRT